MDELLQQWSITSVINSVRTLSARICYVSRAYKPRRWARGRIKCSDIKYTSVFCEFHEILASAVLYTFTPSGLCAFFDWVEPSALVFGSPCLWLGDTYQGEMLSRMSHSGGEEKSLTDNKEADLSVLRMYLWDFTEKCFFCSDNSNILYTNICIPMRWNFSRLSAAFLSPKPTPIFRSLTLWMF